MLHVVNKISLAALTCATLMMSSCGDIRPNTDTNDKNKKSFSVSHFKQVKALEKTLAWSDNYAKRHHFLDYIIPSAHAVLPPNVQPHYIKRFVFNHQKKTVKVINKRFRGTDASNIQRSESTKGIDVYRQFKKILSAQPLLCSAPKTPMMVGPIQPGYSLKLKNKQVYFVDKQNWSANEGSYQLCNNDLASYINQF